MFDTVIIVGSILVLLFGFVVAFGAPYLPTLSKQVEEAIDMLGLKKGQSMLELGSGDGKVLLAAAKRGIKSVGYEINPILVIWSRLRCWRYRKLVKVHLQSYWSAKWPSYDGIYVFLLPKYMHKLDTKIMQSLPAGKKIKVVTFAAELPSRKSKAQSNGLTLYSLIKD